MNKEILQQELKALPLSKLDYFDSINSTNDLAAKWAAADSPDLSLIVANEQTSGRGRSGRKWHTPADSAIAFSLLLRPNTGGDNFFKSEAVSLYTGLGAVAVCVALEKGFSLQPKIKWPNDVLIAGEKVCGVLAESHWLGNHLSAIVIGIGINIASSSIPNKQLLNYPATCLEQAVGKSVDRVLLIRDILTALISLRSSQTAQSFLAEWEARLAFKNAAVLIQQTGKAEEIATIEGLDEHGQIILSMENGQKISKHYEEIQIRPLVDSSRN
ncbi:MAG: biotin--[acetyl-CoA-carboxylase] ligase [Chloroflexota bacterium]